MTPDVILLDIEMPRMNGIAAAEEALKRWPDLKIITLSMYGDEDYYFKMVSLGVKGFILKNSEIKDVVAAIEAVAEGGSFFSQELLFNLVSGSRRSCFTSAAENPTTKSPTHCLYPNVPSISTDPISWLKRGVRIRPIW